MVGLAEVVSACKLLTCGKNSSGSETVYTVPYGQVFTLRRVRVNFDSAADFKLKIVIRHGDFNVCPRSGELTSDGTNAEAEASFTYRSGEKVIASWVNENETTDLYANVTVIGDLE
jgi:hypothetical protein